MSRDTTWSLEVDWDGDGVYLEEATSMVDLSTERGRSFFLKSDFSGFEPLKVGKFSATLNNLDGRYDPYNTRSPLYPFVSQGAPFRLRATYAGQVHDVLRGRISNINPTGEIVERVTLQGEDESTFLRNNSVISPLQTGSRVDEAIGAILTAAGWTGGSALETFSDVIPYWWASGKRAWDEIMLLNDASLGKFFIAADGQAKYYSRLRGRTPVQALTEGDIQAGITMPQPWEVIRNDINLIVSTRTAQTSGELWRLRDKPLVPAGGSLTLWGEYRYGSESAPATTVIDPAATTDYTMNSLTDGSGTNLTANFTVTATKYADRVKLVIANGGGTGGYITLLKIRGQALTTTPTILNMQDSTSIARFQQRKFEIDTKWLQEINIANDILTVLTDYLSDVQSYPAVRLRNKPDLQLTPDLFDHITLNFPSKNISEDYALGYIQHKWLEPTGNLFETKFSFEPPLGAADDYWVFDAILGVTTRFAG